MTDTFRERVDLVILNDDPEGAHIEEDGLLWEFVKAQAEAGHRDAVSLMRLEEISPERTRWYA